MKFKNLRIVLLVFTIFNFQFLTIKVRAQVCFSPASNFSAGPGPVSVTTADFNGDGKADLATSDAQANVGDISVSVLLGDGTGGFGVATGFGSTVSSNFVISADFNGDSKPDLATTNPGINKVSVFIGNGNGTFNTATSFSVGNSPISVISADFNGDGKADLATANSNGANSVSVLLGDGTGNFSAATSLIAGYAPYSITSGDFNGDSKIDLAVGCQDVSNNVSIFLGNGLGSFGSVSNISVSGYPHTIISADFNADNKADLAIGTHINSTNKVMVLLGNGTGGFTAAVPSLVSSDPYTLTSADFNLDGKTDLAVTLRYVNSVSVLPGDGTGNFGTASTFSLGEGPFSVTNADFNADGKPDLAATNFVNNNVSILLNILPIVTANATSTTVCAGASVTLTGGGATTYTWTGGVTDGTAFAAPTITTTYTVTGTIAGCSATATKVITVNPLPTVTIAATQSICTGGDPTVFTESVASTGTALTYQWKESTDGYSITLATTPTYDVPAGLNTTTTYRRVTTSTLNALACSANSNSVIVTVNPIPSVTNGSTASVCSGIDPNISLTASTTSTFVWTIGTITGGITGASAASGSTINQTLTNPSNSLAGTVQYIVTPTSTGGSCIGAAFTITVTVNPSPAITTATTAAICSGTNPNISLTTSSPSTFAWTIGTITGSITGASASSGSTINQTLTNPSNSLAGTIQYIVIPTSTTGSCAGAAVTITVTVYPTPAITNAATAAICSDLNPNISLTASSPSTFTWTIGTITGGITGASAASGSTINQTLINPSNSVSGTVQFIITPTSTAGSCAGAAFTITVTVNPTPVITNETTAATCSGTNPNISLTTSSPSTFAWTIGTITGSITGASAASGSTINQTLTNPSNSLAGIVEYIVTPTSTTGSCIGSTAVAITVTVNPTPAISNAATAAICSGMSPNISLTATTTSAFAWTIGTITGAVIGTSIGSGTSINQTLIISSNSVAGTVQYIITPTSTTGSCSGVAFTITLTVNPAPAITTNAIASICSGTDPNISLTASVPSTFIWTPGTITGSIAGATSSSGATINQTLTNPSNSISGTVQYIITPTSNAGSCAGTASAITVSVYPTPAITNAANAIICSGNGPNISLNASLPSTFTWTIGLITGSVTGASSGSGTTISQILTNSSNSATGTVEYIVTPSSITDLCEGSVFIITITVNPTPIMSSSNSVTICGEAIVNLSLTSSVGSFYSWIASDNSNTTGESITAQTSAILNNTIINNTSSLQILTYSVTPTSTIGNCVGTSQILSVTVNPLPVSNAGTDLIVCSGTIDSIGVEGVAGNTYSWNSSIGITDSTVSDPDITTINTTGTPIVTTYTLTATTTLTGCQSTDNTIVTVYPQPVLVITGPADVCFPSTVDITAGTVTAGSTGGGTLSYWTNSGATSALTSPNAVPASGTNYIKVTATGGCTDIEPVTITVNPQPTATFTALDESSSLYCDGSIVADLTGGTGTIQPEWLDNTQTVLATIDSIGGLCQGSYTLNLIDVNLCTNTYTETIQAGPLPPSPPICLITVDSSNTHNIVVWEKTNLDMTAIDSFIVYREISTNSYQPIGAVSKDSLSTFDDFAANPATTGYRYKLKSKNTHDVASFFSDYHNTIYLTNTGANFSWTPYQIENNTTPVSNYYIYRDDNSTGNFQTIGNTTGNQFGYTDIQFASFPDASYYVEAVMVAGACQPTRTDFTASRSNVKHFGAAGVQELNNHTIVNIYPNPAGNTLNINGITGKTTLLLYDVVGKLVLEKEVENNTILNTSHLAEGIYTLLTVSKMGRSFNKVVISR
ncbi:MAG: PKD-like domain-containing protein [Bacteroidota bacterium]